MTWVKRLHRTLGPLAIGAASLAAAAAARLEQRAVAVDLATPRDLHGGAYAGSAACRRCHEDHYRSWHRTFHRTMTAEATPATVRGDFSGATLRYAGVLARMDRDQAGTFQMTFAPAGGGPARTASVARVVGSRRYQQYLTRVGDSYWRLPVAYHLEERRWFSMNGAFLVSDDSPPAPAAAGRPLFGGEVYDRHVARWNDNCVFCHNVAPDPGRQPITGAFRTTVAELGIACEACHGPGAEHAARNADPVRRYALHAGGAPDPTVVNPARLSPARAADLCGRCHGQRITDDVGPFLAHGDPFVAGDDLALYSAPLWRDTALGGDRGAFAARFWPEGTPRLTAYEYQGLLQSACAQRGALTCTSCHGMHDGDPRGQIRSRFASGAAAENASENASEDGMCTSCHGALADAREKLRHSRHDPAGAGARCVACHMPRIVYGVLDIHRSHRIEIPDPACAGAHGRPDACTGCHVDRSRAWAATAMARLWGRHAADREGEGSGAPLEAVFGGDPIERAVAAEALGGSDAPADGAARARRAGALLEVMAADRYPAVRHLAWRALGRLEPGVVPAAGYDPGADAAERRARVFALSVALGLRATAADPVAVAGLRARALRADVEIGE
jgi:hypothetical protein